MGVSGDSLRYRRKHSATGVLLHLSRDRGWYFGRVTKLSGAPNLWHFLKNIAGINGRRAAVQMGGVLRYKLEAYCGVSLSQILSKA